jgi:hypothetical protein
LVSSGVWTGGDAACDTAKAESNKTSKQIDRNFISRNPAEDTFLFITDLLQKTSDLIYRCSGDIFFFS